VAIKKTGIKVSEELNEGKPMMMYKLKRKCQSDNIQKSNC
jgi:hypothetical protein